MVWRQENRTPNLHIPIMSHRRFDEDLAATRNKNRAANHPQIGFKKFAGLDDFF
jgi:hypothetical protein